MHPNHLLLNNPSFTQKSNDLPLLEKNLFKSYQILFDLWIKSVGPKLKIGKYEKIMKNLFIVNKSYTHYSLCLDPQFFYNDYESIVLSIPIYLYDLMESIPNEDDNLDLDNEDDDYSVYVDVQTAIAL